MTVIITNDEYVRVATDATVSRIMDNCTTVEDEKGVHEIYRTAENYGRVYVDGRKYQCQKVMFAYRHGFVPKQIENTCGHPHCVNPDHWAERWTTKKPKAQKTKVETKPNPTPVVENVSVEELMQRIEELEKKQKKSWRQRVASFFA